MADLHALGQRGGAGGVLQEGDVIALELGRVPARGQQRVQAIHGKQLGRVICRQCLQAVQVVVQCRHGQQQARLGIGDDRQQTLLVMLPRGLRRVSRHCDHARIQAAKKRRHVVWPAREQQHGTVTEAGARLQGSGDGACTLVEVPVAEHGLLTGRVGEKAQGNPVRGLRGALRQGLDQREREFEGVRHGVFLPVSVRACRLRREHGRAASGDRGCTQGNGWTGAEISGGEGFALRQGWGHTLRYAPLEQKHPIII
ncbi:hypothetical protein D3C76_532610 [compost metagenome]